MIRTETAASNLQCRVGGPVIDRMSGGASIIPAFPMCAGSQCMHWVEADPDLEVFMIGDGHATPPAPPAGEGWRLSAVNNKPAYVRAKERRGRCGLINL